MIQIKIPQNLKKTVPSESRTTINSDEVWAFTEQPKIESTKNAPERIDAHRLFDLFTANIIAQKTRFTR